MDKLIRSFLVVALLAVCSQAGAQIADTLAARRVGARIEAGGQKLTRAQSVQLMADIDGEDYSAEWKNARGWRAAGISMISGGAAVAAGGAVVTLIGSLTSMMGAAIGGATGAVVGSVAGGDGSQAASDAANKGAQAGKPLITAGVITFFTGLGIHIAGIPVTVVSCTRMSHLVDRYNDARPSGPMEDPQLTLGFTPNGIGLCLSF